jgi:16S rRNA (cytidine1402-2'-O)-methyltransferase
MEEVNNKEEQKKKGILYIISTPIGNWDDMTLRGIKLLKSCDKVICEEGKAGARILKQYNIHKEIELLNEHNEEERSQDFIFEISKGKRYALISDCGTPVFADPGYALVKAALSRDIEIIVVPGASSIMTAIVRSGFSVQEFLFGGFLSRDKEERIEKLKELSKERRTIVLLETPYRILPFLEAAKYVLPFRHAYIGCNLTMPYETHHYGTFTELFERFREKRFKGEFTIVFEGLPKDKSINAGWHPVKKYDKPFRRDNKDRRARRR